MRGVWQQRGQVTLFFIVGVVLLITALVIYLTLHSPVPPPDEPSLSMLSSSVESCIDNRVETKLRELGANGGAWELQNSNAAIVDDAFVFYGIRPVSIGRDFRGNSPPRYPEWGLRITNTKQNPENPQPTAVPDSWYPMQDVQDGYFGDVLFPGICAKEGPNSRSSSQPCRYYVSPPIGPIGYNYKEYGDLSTQEYLTILLEETASSCINASLVRGALGTEVLVTDQEVNVTFTQQAVLVRVQYELTLDGTTEELVFAPRYSIRYLAIAQFAYDLAREETRNVNFDIMNNASRINSYRDGFTVLKITHADDPDVPENADLISIIDSQSVIEGRDFEYRFLVEHRNPMIDWISKDDVPSSCGPIPGPLAPSPVAVDPDGHALTCSFDGATFKVWKTDEPLLYDCIKFDSLEVPVLDSHSC